MKISLILILCVFSQSILTESLPENVEVSPANSSVETDVVDDESEDVIKESPYSDMELCPYPPADVIDPCKCYVDEQYR